MFHQLFEKIHNPNVEKPGCNVNSLASSYNMVIYIGIFIFSNWDTVPENWRREKGVGESEAHQKTLDYFLFHYKSDKVHESKHQCLGALEVGN